ncbi:outer membrane protein [Thalassotalea sp. ND16A]|uniref:outer membrane protein n=1 Tax=Thalassotalea sp. ND16A TaxID=1535422 RepID=UPI00051A0CC3|nr:outer membrane beta-barrel protein [Thalassotalea sp. ND16A]KGJ93475.1 hypothetical protein ND16A_1492 [Thalassotalea sp. ND16A]
MFKIGLCIIFLYVPFLAVAEPVKETLPGSGQYFKSALIISYTKTSDVSFHGQYLEADPIYFYTDQDTSKSKHDTMDIVFGGLISIGKDYGNWRAEIEYAYRYRTDLKGDLGLPKAELHYKGNISGHINIDINSQSLAVNFLYELPVIGKFTPFTGFGLGYVEHKASGWNRYRGSYLPAKDSTGGMLWQVHVGFEYQWQGPWSAQFSFQYVDLNKLQYATKEQQTIYYIDDIISIDLLLSLRYQF